MTRSLASALPIPEIAAVRVAELTVIGIIAMARIRGETAILAAAKLFLYLGSIPRNRLPAYIQIVLAGRAMQEIGRENLAGLWVGVNRLFMV